MAADARAGRANGSRGDHTVPGLQPDPTDPPSGPPAVPVRPPRFSRLRRDRTGPAVYYGWWIVLAGAIMQLLQGTLLGQAYGAYVVVLSAQFGWSKTILSGAAVVREMESGIVGFIQGPLLDRFGPRNVARVGIVALAAGFFLFSQVNSPVTFYIAFFTMALGASLMGYLTLTYTVVQWFETKRSTALSLMSLGGAFGGVVVPITVLAIETFGWRTTTFASGVIVLLVGIPLTQLLRREPAEMGLPVDGLVVDLANPNAHHARTVEEDFNLREALREPSFWWISFGHGSALFVVGAVNVHMIAHITGSLDYSLGVASLVYSGVTTMFMIGTVAGGWIGDRASKRALAMVCMGLHCAGMLLLSHATGGLMVGAFVVLHGLAWGMRGPQMAALRADYFGRTAFGKIMGVSNGIVILGAIAGPLTAGILFDRTGTYVLGFDILALLAGAGATFFFLAKRPKPKELAA